MENEFVVNMGKTIRGLIEELQSFEDQDLKVKISTDDGVNLSDIRIVKKSRGVCLLVGV